MSADEAYELCQLLLPETLAQIRADRKKASARVVELLDVIERRLLDPDLNVDAILKDAEQRDQNVSTRFAADPGVAPWAYVLGHRMELAGRMLIASKFQVWRVGTQVGYPHPGSFNRAFKKWSDGKTPGQFRKAAQSEAAEPETAAIELASRDELKQAVAGKLPPERARAVVGQLFELGQRISAGYEDVAPPAAARRHLESTMARSLWRWICDLPYEVQVRAIESQAPRYHTLVLFNRLCTVSAEAEDDIRGLQGASLVMIALKAVSHRLDKEVALSAFPRAWAIAGNAERRAGNLDQAAKVFRQATRMLEHAGDAAHPIVVAELAFYQAMLEIERDNFEWAEKLIVDGAEILRRFGKRLFGEQEEDSAEEDGGQAMD